MQSQYHATETASLRPVPVQSVAGRTGDVTLSVADVAGAAPAASPTFTGTATVRTGSCGYVQLAPSASDSDGNAGQVVFFTGPDNTRRASIGGKGTGNALQFKMEGGWALEMLGGTVSIGGPAGAEGLRVPAVANATRCITAAGSAGGNPTLGTTAGNLDIRPAGDPNGITIAGGNYPFIASGGQTASLSLTIAAKQAGLFFNTNTALETQFQVARTPSADRAVVVTGSQGGNPSIGVTGGALLAFSVNPVLRSYTVGTLPSAAQAGQLIYVGDGGGNKRLAVSDGAGWRWPDGSPVN